MNDPRSEASSFQTRQCWRKENMREKEASMSLLEEMDGSAWKEIHDNPVSSWYSPNIFILKDCAKNHVIWTIQPKRVTHFLPVLTHEKIIVPIYNFHLLSWKKIWQH